MVVVCEKVWDGWNFYLGLLRVGRVSLVCRGFAACMNFVGVEYRWGTGLDRLGRSLVALNIAPAMLSCSDLGLRHRSRRYGRPQRMQPQVRHVAACG